MTHGYISCDAESSCNRPAFIREGSRSMFEADDLMAVCPKHSSDDAPYQRELDSPHLGDVWLAVKEVQLGAHSPVRSDVVDHLADELDCSRNRATSLVTNALMAGIVYEPRDDRIARVDA